ncbi:MAG: thioesterase [Eubacteriales bacterium]|nr:thioesterase [Eubacteriales bacterium]
MFEMTRQITYSQVGQNLLVDMAMLTHFFQDCTLFHSDSIGKGVRNLEDNRRAWFLSSWQIEVVRYPSYGERIRVRTWPHDFKGLYGYRNFEILDEQGEQIARANSIWIFMDVENLRPMKPEPEDVEGYEMSPALDMEYAPRKIKVMQEAEAASMQRYDAIRVRRSFIDSNSHVNNGRYVTEAMEYVQNPEAITKMRVDYRKAATLGDYMIPVVYCGGDCEQIVFEDEQQQPYVIMEMM